MMQVINPTRKITLHISVYDQLEPNKRYMIWIQEPEYKDIGGQGANIDECLSDLAKSLGVIEIYRRNEMELRLKEPLKA